MKRLAEVAEQQANERAAQLQLQETTAQTSMEVAPSDIVDPEKEELKKKEAEMQKMDIMAKTMEKIENQLQVAKETQ